MPHRLVRTGAAVQTSPPTIPCSKAVYQADGGRPVDMIRENPGPRGRPFNVRAVASDRADVVSRVDAAIGEQAF